MNMTFIHRIKRFEEDRIRYYSKLPMFGTFIEKIDDAVRKKICFVFVI